MTPEQIQTFLAVVRRGSFTKAAEELFLTQPAVSQKIQLLEKQLGMRLFDRTGKTLRINQAGERFLQYSQALKRETEALYQDLKTLVGDPLESFVIGTVQSVGTYAMPALIASFKALHPHTRIGLEIGNTEELVNKLMRGSLDFAIVDTELPRLRMFQCDFLLDEAIALAVPPQHPLSGKRLTLEELYDIPLIMRHRASRTRYALEAELQQGGVDLRRLRVAYEFDNIEAIKQSIAAGLGCGFLPLDSIVQFLHLGLLSQAHWNRPLRRKIWLYTKKTEGANLQLFKGYLLEKARKWAGQGPAQGDN